MEKREKVDEKYQVLWENWLFRGYLDMKRTLVIGNRDLIRDILYFLGKFILNSDI